MPDAWERVRTKSSQMIDKNSGLREAQYGYERMSRVDYKLPEELRLFEYLHPIVSTSPFNALKGATLALSNLQEHLEVNPVTLARALPKGHRINSRFAYRMAAEWEAALKWQVNIAARRRKAFRSTAMWSAALYDEIAAQVIHLPTQFKARKRQGVRERAALRFGDWAFRMVDPKTVTIEYSDLMPERVLYATLVTAQEIVDEFPDTAGEIGKKIEDDQDHATIPYMKFDYTDYDHRGVWAVEGETESLVEQPGVVLQELAPWLKDLDGEPVPFLPWVAAAGGIEIDAQPEHQRKPILYPVYQAELWSIENIFGTMLFSSALADQASEVDVFKGPGVEGLRVDRSKPRGRVNLTALQSYDQIKRQGLDSGLREAYDRLDQAIKTATVAEVLVTAQPAENIAAGYAFSLQIQAALASLGAVKTLGETWHDRIYETMLLITHYTGGEIVGYGLDRKKRVADRYVIDGEDIDPESIYLQVRLQPDVPTERLQLIQAAANLANVPGVSPYKVLETIGDTDPDGSIREWKMWRMDLADLEGYLQRIQAEASGQYERDVAAAAEAMVQQRLAAEAETEALSAPPANMPEVPMRGRSPEDLAAPQGMEGVEGGIVNPNEGGFSPLELAPATRENQTGRTLAGTALPTVP